MRSVTKLFIRKIGVHLLITHKVRVCIGPFQKTEGCVVGSPYM